MIITKLTDKHSMWWKVKENFFVASEVAVVTSQNSLFELLIRKSSGFGYQFQKIINIPWCRLFKGPNLEKIKFFNQYISYNDETYFFWKYIVWAFSGTFFHDIWTIFRNFMKLWSWGVFLGCGHFLKCYFSKNIFHMIFTLSLSCQQNFITELYNAIEMFWRMIL